MLIFFFPNRMMNRSDHKLHLPCSWSQLEIFQSFTTKYKVSYLKYQISHWESYLILHLPTASSLTDTQFHHVIFFYIHRIMVSFSFNLAMRWTALILSTLPCISDESNSVLLSACLWICSIFFLILYHFLISRSRSCYFLNEGGIISFFHFL